MDETDIEEGEVKFGKMTEPKARKDHGCSWCPEPIKKGEKYLRFSMLYEGEFVVEKKHPECNEACNKHMNELNKQGGDIERFDFEDHSFKRGTGEMV